MAYKALYNKYRPSTFEEVCGQQAIVKTLRNSISSGKIAHAYLFTGPRGTGKTSMARLFAKALNCEEGLGHQCNHCSNCEALNNASHPDVIEIDAASNSGVENVRDLIEKVRYSPIKGKYKIYIIDEVHSMSQGAFNALLKTLEEPPENVVFILATTEVHKVMPTILSRCQRYDFGKLEENEIKGQIIKILGLEQIDYEESAVNVLVSLADGGMRDALSLLDQALAYGGNCLKEADVLSVFGLASLDEKIKLLELISSGNVAEVLAKFNAFVDSGIDISRLAFSLMDILKDSLVFQKTKAKALLTTINEESAAKLAGLLSAEKMNQLISLLLKATIDFKSVTNIRSLFELSLLQMTSAFSTTEIKAKPETVQEEAKLETAKPEAPKPIEKESAEPVLEKEPEQKESYNPDSGQTYTGTTPPQFLFEEEGKAANAENNSSEPKNEKAKIAIAEEGEKYQVDDETIIKIMVKGTKFKSSRQELRDKWNNLETLKFDEEYSEVATLLSEGKPFCLCDEALLINFSFTRFKDKANLIANQEALSNLVATLIGRKVFIIGLDRNDSNRTQKHYFDLNQIHKLPKIEEIELNLPKGGK